MRLLLDTYIFIGLSRQTLFSDYPGLSSAILEKKSESFVSVASIWEIAIKTRLGKLDAGMSPERIADYCIGVGLRVLPIQAAHASAEIDPLPDTNDPFDRLLLAQCKVEGLQLVTADRALAEHPLSLRV